MGSHGSNRHGHIDKLLAFDQPVLYIKKGTIGS